MTTQELEELLEAGREIPNLDYKGSCPWSVESFAKDILAMSNVQDGGHIIIGVEEAQEGTYRRCGVQDAHKETYKIDVMKDQMASYADPHTDFALHCPSDREGRAYVIIHVHAFEEIPVICKKDSRDTRRATIYYRNRDRRVESAAVSNSYDLREILDRATVKRMQRLDSLGLIAKGTRTVTDILDEEINDL